jgi:putative transposase
VGKASELSTTVKRCTTEEALLSQQQRDLEGASIREAIVGQSKTINLEPGLADIEMDDEFDLTALPALEEYR